MQHTLICVLAIGQAVMQRGRRALQGRKWLAGWKGGTCCRAAAAQAASLLLLSTGCLLLFED